jgi:antitoxin VapB
LARSLVRLTGETMTEAVTAALRERLGRERARRAADADFAGAARRVIRALAGCL